MVQGLSSLLEREGKYIVLHKIINSFFLVFLIVVGWVGWREGGGRSVFEVGKSLLLCYADWTAYGQLMSSLETRRSTSLISTINFFFFLSLLYRPCLAYPKQAPLCLQLLYPLLHNLSPTPLSLLSVLLPVGLVYLSSSSPPIYEASRALWFPLNHVMQYPNTLYVRMGGAKAYFSRALWFPLRSLSV